MLYLLLMCSLLEVKAQITNLPTSGYNLINLLDDTFVMRGHAVAQGSFCYLITRDMNSQRGQIWWPDMLDLTQDFRLDFVISAGSRDGGADGYAFVLHRDTRGLEARGAAGYGLGVGGITSGANRRISPSLSVEIDTYRNSDSFFNSISLPSCSVNDYSDPSDDHLSLLVNGAAHCPEPIRTSNENNVLQSGTVLHTPILSDGGNVEDNNLCFRMSIVWDYIGPNDQRIRVFTSDTDGTNPNLRLLKRDNFINDIFGGETEVMWGYTGSTGGARNQQTICLPTGFGDPLPVDDNWEIGSGQAFSLNVVSNDIINSQHPDLWVTRIVTPPTNGTATMESNQKVITYNTNPGYTGTDQLVYEVCDVEDNTRCYARCAQGTLDITVACPEGRTVLLSKTSDNSGCDANLSTGSVVISVVEQIDMNEITYVEEFTNSSVGSTEGSSTQEDGQGTSWTVTEIASASGGETAQVEEMPNMGRYLSVPPGGEYEIDFSLFLPDALSQARLFWDLGVAETGMISSSAQVAREDANGNFLALNGAGVSYLGNFTSGNRQTYELIISQLEIGDHPGNYSIRLRVQNNNNSVVDLVVDNVGLEVTPTSATTGAQDVTSEYAFRWYEGSSVATGTLLPGLTTSTANNLTHSFYTVEALLVPNSSCPLEPENPVEIEQIIESTSVQIAENSPVTNCGSPNGELSATVLASGVLTTTGYTFTWYETIDLNTPERTGPTASNLSALSYTVKVRDNSTGCIVSESKTVSSTLTSPSITLEDKTNALTCGGSVGTGEARVSSGGVVAGFTFEWFNGRSPVSPSVLPGTPDFTGSYVQSLSVGYYTVQAVDVTNDCPSAPLEIEIEDVVEEINITGALEGSSACAAPYNGKLSVEASYAGVVLPVSDFSFEFFSGANTLSVNGLLSTSLSGAGPYISDGHVLNRLSSGQYTVRVFHTASSCVKDTLFTILSLPSALPVVSVSSVVVGHNSICSGGSGLPTGSIDASSSVATGGSISLGGYLYSLSSSLLTPSPVENSTGVFADLLAGDYVLEVKDLSSSCSTSSGITLRIEERSNLDLIRIDSQVSDTSCVANGGSGSVSYTTVLVSGGLVSNYRHELYRGSNRAAVNRLFQEVTSSGGHTFTDLEDGTYRIVVWDVSTNCFEELDINIADDPFYPRYGTPSSTIEGDNSCSSDNGEIELHLVGRQNSSIADPYGLGYRFSWYRGSTNQAVNAIVGEDGSVLNGRESGTYAVTIEGPNGCETPTVRSFMIPDKELVFGVNIVDSNVLTSCLESEANGSLRGELTSGHVSSDFSFEWWYDSSLPSPPSIVSGVSGTGITTGEQIDNRWEGQYAVRATHTSSGCSEEDIHILRSTRVSPVLSLSLVIDNRSCSAPWDGSSEVSITYEGSVVSDISGYSFTLDGISITPSFDAVAMLLELSALGANTVPGYMLEASRRGCVGRLRIGVGDGRVLPALSGGLVRDSRSCDESVSPDGELRVSPDGSDGTGYSFTWYGQSYSSPPPSEFVPSSVQIGTSPTGTGANHLVGLRSGSYSVLVVNEATRCERTRDYVIDLTPNTAPTGTLSKNDVTVCVPPNGSIRIDLTGGASSVDYTWEWYLGQVDPLDVSTFIPLSGGDVSVPGEARMLPVGYYSVRWTESATACRSGVRSVYVDVSSTVKPLFSVSNPTPAGDCRGAVGVGRIDVVGPGGRIFDIRVYAGAPSDFSTATPEVEELGRGVGIFDTSLPATTYLVRLTETVSQCDSVERLTIDYIDSPTVIDIVNIEPSNCAPYANSAGDGGAGGASGSVQLTLEVDATSGIDHDSYQLFLYAAPDLNSSASFSPTPDMLSSSMEWRVSDGRPRIIQSISASESGSAMGLLPTDPGGPSTGALGSNTTVNSAGRNTRDYIFAGLAGNTNVSIENYLIVAAEEGQASCFSTPESFNVPRGNNDILIPDVQIGASAADALGRTIIANGSCGAQLSSNGSVQIRGIERSGGTISGTTGTEIGSVALQVYAFEWFEGGTISSDVLGTAFGSASAERASNLPSGRYALRVTKRTGADDLGCSNIFVWTVNNDMPTLSITDVAPSHITSCVAPGDAGSIEVQNVDVGSGAVSFSSLSDPPWEVIVRSSTNVQQLPNLVSSTSTKGDLSEDVYTLVLRNTSTECQSPGLLQSIEDNRDIPNLNKSGSTITSNTHCETPNGGVLLAFGSGTSLSALGFIWHEGVGTTNTITGVLSDGSVATGFTTDDIAGLSSGDFTVLVSHTSSSCEIEETFFVPDGRAYPVLSFDPTSLSHSTTCTGVGDGSVEIAGSDISPSPGVYNVELFSEASLSTLVWSEVLDNTVSSTVVSSSSLSFTTFPSAYYIHAKDQSTGCASFPASRFEIRDESEEPQLESYAVLNDKGCGSGSLGIGAVDVRLFIPDASYSYTVTIGTTTESGVVTPVVPQIGGLPSGTLPIAVENTVTGCRYVSEVEIGKEEPLFRIESLVSTDQTYCDALANGTIQVLGLRFDADMYSQTSGAVSVYSDFDFVWSDGSGSSRTPVEEYELLNLEAGDYSVELTHPGSSCIERATFTVKENVLGPLLAVLEISKDSSCVASTATGVLLASGDGRDDMFDSDGDGSDYVFSWTDEDGNGSGSGSRVERLVGGMRYNVEVMNTETGCRSAREGILVAASPIMPLVDVERSLSYGEVTVCLSPSDGVLEVVGVSPGVLSDYVLRFYDVDPSSTPSPPPAETVENGLVRFEELGLQAYYFELAHKLYGCRTGIYEVMPPDGTVRPDVVLEEVVLQTHCDPDRPNGELEVSAEGIQDTEVYDFEWRYGGDVISAVGDAETRLTELRAGPYVVIVTDKSTGCSTEEEFVLRDLIINPLEVSFDIRSNSRCVEDYDGIIIVDVVEKLPGKQLSDYSFYWQEGNETPTEANSLHNGNAWERRNTGTYTVIAYDKDDSFCKSAPTLAVVGDVRPVFAVEIVQVEPLTYCDPERPNARLRAIIINEPEYVMSYQFRWYEVPDAILSMSYEAEHLGDRTYFVEAIHSLSGCTGGANYTVVPVYDYPLPPQLLLERSRTDCSTPNGVALALVHEGLLSDYSFEWYPFSDPSLLVSEESRAEGLDVGIYHVYITSKKSGCRSLDPGVIEVFNAVAEKRYRILTSPSLCTRATGSAEIIPIDPFSISSVEWRNLDEGTIYNTVVLDPASPGEYEVEVSDESNCVFDSVFVLPERVEAYNGVSVNGDGMNDTFVIDCIERYPENMLRLFDRDGNLVYEQERYNNEEHVFTGEGNKGLYIGGKRLPDGTYYYVIESNETGLVVSGFMELIN